MGLYDTFQVIGVKCPVCGKDIVGSQSKHWKDSLQYFKIGEDIRPKHSDWKCKRNEIFETFITCGYISGRGFHYSKDIRLEVKNYKYIGPLHGRTHTGRPENKK